MILAQHFLDLRFKTMFEFNEFWSTFHQIFKNIFMKVYQICFKFIIFQNSSISKICFLKNSTCQEATRDVVSRGGRSQKRTCRLHGFCTLLFWNFNFESIWRQIFNTCHWNVLNIFKIILALNIHQVANLSSSDAAQLRGAHGDPYPTDRKSVV